MRDNAISSRSFIRPVMFKLELEWTVGVGGTGEGRKDACTKRLLRCQTPPDYLRFHRLLLALSIQFYSTLLDKTESSV